MTDLGRTTVTYDEAATVARLHAGGPVSLGLIGKTAIKTIAVGAGSSAEVDSGFDFPASAVIRDVYVEVTTAESTGSTKTLDVGLLSSESGGDADAFLDGVSVATAGIVQGLFTAVDGTNQNYFTTTKGVKLYSGSLGGDAAGTAAAAMIKPYIVNGAAARSLSYSRGDTFVEFVGKIHILYDYFE